MLLDLFEAFDTLTSENSLFPLLSWHSTPVIFLLSHWLLLLYSLLFLCLVLECWHCPRLSPKPSALLTHHTPTSQYCFGSGCHLHVIILEIISISASLTLSSKHIQPTVNHTFIQLSNIY